MIDHATAVKYAPYLHFSSLEHFYPCDPEIFRRHSRFNRLKCKANSAAWWNHAKERWSNDKPQDGDPAYLAPPWDQILKAIAKDTKALRPGGPEENGSVACPDDRKNLWGPKSHCGYSLELANHGEDGLRGCCDETSVGFYDIVEWPRKGAQSGTVLTYWFFYAQNPALAAQHEGDWEHFSLYFSLGSETPTYAYLAAHTGGRKYRFDAPELNKKDKTHVELYVERDAHACYATQEETAVPVVFYDKGKGWPSWKATLLPLTDQPWHLYDGSWGRFSDQGDHPGPLGPFFKRGRDQVKFPG